MSGCRRCDRPTSMRRVCKKCNRVTVRCTCERARGGGE